MPRDTPIEVNSEELFKWGGIANINNWPKDILDERRKNKVRTRGVGVITHFVKQLLARGVAIRPGQQGRAPGDGGRPRRRRRHRQGPHRAPRAA